MMMIDLSFNDLINYKIASATDLQVALADIATHVLLSRKVQQEVMIAVRQKKEYLNVIKTTSGEFHGLSVTQTDDHQTILTYYQFH